MDDTIVIILTLLVAVIGAVGQIKKKNRQQTVTEENEPVNDFWDIINQEADDVAERNETVINKETFQAEVPITEKNEPGFSAINENTDEKKAMQRKVPSAMKRTFTKKDFSLRKAVIYSEILNRKYQ